MAVYRHVIRCGHVKLSIACDGVASCRMQRTSQATSNNLALEVLALSTGVSLSAAGYV